MQRRTLNVLRAQRRWGHADSFKASELTVTAEYA